MHHVKVRDVMTTPPRCLDVTDSVMEAARMMRDDDIGDVLVCTGETVCGIVTDRDIVVRMVADGRSASETRLGDICTQELKTLSPEDSEDDAVRMMRENAIRRLPVVENGRPIGMLTIGDLAIDLDRQSALADISAAPANN